MSTPEPLGSAFTAPEAPVAEEPAPPPPNRADLAAHLAGRLCHDLISPVSAIVSGLDLLDDPSAQDMRDDAMNLIAQSARKLASSLSFARVAYGSSASAETFDPKDLETLTQGVFSHVRAELDWAVGEERLPKSAARALLNLAQLGATALPTGGVAHLTLETGEDEIVLQLKAQGARARLRPEAQSGLRGEAAREGLPGQWVQPYYLATLVADAGGALRYELAEDCVTVVVNVPKPAY
ncbi:MAG TPA: histidine phosphotransferase family protein [Caulobacteraceae bacterium]|nr:histidine phosphotransferase family protein [Caulobacteraceae bacterium]